MNEQTYRTFLSDDLNTINTIMIYLFIAYLFTQNNVDNLFMITLIILAIRMTIKNITRK